MSKKIWNEGRVVGYSSYEMYVKNFLERYPDQVPASERQWTASMLGMGASMLVKVTGNAGSNQSTQPTIIDIPLPEHSMLCACSTIMANLFLGEGVYEGDSKWAKRVKSYGPLMTNTSSIPASSADGKLNTSYSKPRATNFNTDWRKKMTNYLKIVDGVVLQPGYWTSTQSKDKNNPPKDMRPDLRHPPTVRLLLSHALTCDIEILLTGFVNMTIVDGSVALDGSTLDSFDYDSAIEQGIPRVPDNDSGDFLGPAEFPWATKIMFSVPNEAFNYLNLQKFTRVIFNKEDEIQQAPIIDFMQANLPGGASSVYSYPKSGATQSVTMKKSTTVNGKSSVISVFSRRNTTDPPALWGAVVEDTDTSSTVQFHPLAVVSPGTVRMFESASFETFRSYEDTYPGTFSLGRDSSGWLWTLTNTLRGRFKVPVAGFESEPWGEDAGCQARLIRLRFGNMETLALNVCSDGKKALSGSGDDVRDGATPIPLEQETGTTIKWFDGTDVCMGTRPSIQPYSSNITWVDLLNALVNKQVIDILGPELKALKKGLAASPPYIPFKNGLRLYVSKTAPSGDIPENSIGLGW